MTGLINFVMLIAACFGSMAFGVLAAYAVLRAAFGLMRPQGSTVAVKAEAREVRI
jgi:hypothetical protein